MGIHPSRRGARSAMLPKRGCAADEGFAAVASCRSIAVQRIESAEFVGGQGNRSRIAAASVSRLKQLQGDRRSMSGNGDELKQSLGGLDLAVLEAQSLFLEQPKQLFDDPSRPVPVDDLPSGINIGDRM